MTSFLKPKKSKKGVLIASAIAGAVGTGVTLLYTTKKGKSLRSDASKKVDKLSSGVTSLLDSAEKKLKKVGKEVKQAEKKANTGLKKTKKLNNDIRKKVKKKLKA